MFARSFIDSMFPSEYPIQPEHGEHQHSFEERLDRTMVIHGTWPHFGDLLIVGANTGRKVQPDHRYGDREWLDHQCPQLNSTGGWTTRFDGGRYGGKEPSIIVALFYRGSPDWDMEGCYGLDMGFALVKSGDKLYYVQAPMPHIQVGILCEDGLEAMHEVLLALREESHDHRWKPARDERHPHVHKPLPILKAEDVPEDIRAYLEGAVEHVENSFRQGPIPRKVDSTKRK